MILRNFALIVRALVGVVFALILNACNKPDGSRILGHWRAEKLSVQGLSIPIAPELLISRNQLRSPDGTFEIFISSIKEDDNKVVLGIPMGLGLSFQFVSSDRISFEVPLVGTKIFYQRIGSVTSIDEPQQTGSQSAVQSNLSTVTKSPQTKQASVTQVDSSQNFEKKNDMVRPKASETIITDQRKNIDPISYYNQSIHYMRLGDSNEAVRSLRDAFEYGFRDFNSIEESKDFVPLKNDPRFIALITRYR